MNQPQLDTEKIHISIGISSTYWGKKPQYAISIDDIELLNTKYAEKSDVIVYHNFTVDLETNKPHTLSISLLNKTDRDTIENDDKTAILKDMLLNIESIEIEDIELGMLKWSHSKFVPIDSHRPTLTKCTNLGWNGHFQIEFSCPFYIWLLENS